MSGEWREYEKLVLHELKELKDGQNSITNMLHAHIKEETNVLISLNKRFENTKIKTSIMWGAMIFLVAPTVTWAINHFIFGGKQ